MNGRMFDATSWYPENRTTGCTGGGIQNVKTQWSRLVTRTLVAVFEFTSCPCQFLLILPRRADRSCPLLLIVLLWPWTLPARLSAADLDGFFVKQDVYRFG